MGIRDLVRVGARWAVFTMSCGVYVCVCVCVSIAPWSISSLSSGDDDGDDDGKVTR